MNQWWVFYSLTYKKCSSIKFIIHYSYFFLCEKATKYQLKWLSFVSGVYLVDSIHTVVRPASSWRSTMANATVCKHIGNIQKEKNLYECLIALPETPMTCWSHYIIKVIYCTGMMQKLCYIAGQTTKGKVSWQTFIETPTISWYALPRRKQMLDASIQIGIVKQFVVKIDQWKW